MTIDKELTQARRQLLQDPENQELRQRFLLCLSRSTENHCLPAWTPDSQHFPCVFQDFVLLHRCPGDSAQSVYSAWCADSQLCMRLTILTHPLTKQTLQRHGPELTNRLQSYTSSQAEDWLPIHSFNLQCQDSEAWCLEANWPGQSLLESVRHLTLEQRITQLLPRFRGLAASLGHGQGRGRSYYGLCSETVRMDEDSLKLAGAVRAALTPYELTTAFEHNSSQFRTSSCKALAPEQKYRFEWDERSVIFQFGSLFYETLSGRPPMTRSHFVKLMTRNLMSDLPIEGADDCPDIPNTLERILMKCLARNPDHRYQCFKDLEQDLKRIENGQEPHAPEIPDSAFEEIVTQGFIDRWVRWFGLS